MAILSKEHYYHAHIRGNPHLRGRHLSCHLRWRLRLLHRRHRQHHRRRQGVTRGWRTPCLGYRTGLPVGDYLWLRHLLHLLVHRRPAWLQPQVCPSWQEHSGRTSECPPGRERLEQRHASEVISDAGGA